MDPVYGRNVMDERIYTYFQGEKQAGAAFAALGAIALLLSLALWRGRGDLRGMVYPLVLFGLVQIGVGGGLLLRTDAQVAGLVEQYQRAPAAFRESELERMKKVQRSFQLIKAAELVLLATGAGLAFGVRSNRFWSAVGLGLVAQMAVMLAFDLLAEKRGKAYLEQLEIFDAAREGDSLGG
jgi:hypothetical protein